MSALSKSPPYGLLERLEAGVCRLLASNPSAFTYTGTQTYLVGEKELVVIDPGPDLPEHREVLLRAIDDRPVIAICCTHTHRDHSPGSRALAAATGAPIIGCAPLVLDESGPRGDSGFDRDYAPERVLGDGDALTFDGHKIVAVATPGHTSNHLCFALEGSGALFSGDHVMGWSTTVVMPPDGDMSDYMASLDKLRRRSDRIYYPAHGAAVTNPQQLVRHMMGHRLQRERQIVRLIKDEPRTIREIVAEAYPGLDPRLTAAAGGSVLAHLLDLERRGLVVAEQDKWTVL